MLLTSGHPMHPRQVSSLPRSFSLVELLVVVSILALLMAILLPSLRKAREQAKLGTCASQLRQVGASIHAYAADERGHIPRGPTPTSPYDFEGNTIATNQVWIGKGSTASPAQHPMQFNALGALLPTRGFDRRVLFCPADNNFNRAEEMPRIGTDDSAYGSYLYRQLDHLPDGATGLLDQLGANRVSDQLVRVETLALDMNSLGPAAYGLRHTNHAAAWANILFRDGSVARQRNRDDLFALAASVFTDLAKVPVALDQLLTRADVAYRGDPASAPVIPTSAGPN